MSIIKDFKFYVDDEDAERYSYSYYLLIDFKRRVVSTNCGDFYYDYDINFDDFIKVAEYIKEKDKEEE